MTFFEGLQSAAVSLVVAGNEGVAPFLTLFLVGIIEKARPDLLSMGETMENIVASWPGLLFFGIMAVIELISKCVPVLDEIVDSVMIWIVPFMSVLGTLSTMGLVNFDDGTADGEGRRQLSVASGALLFLQIVLIIFGICLALSMHLTKMFVRMIGVGWLTGILTVVEITWTITTVTMAIFIQQLAIFLAVVMISGAAIVVKRKWWDKRHGDVDEMGHDAHVGGEGQRIRVHESTGGDDTITGSGGGNYHATDQKGFPLATPAV
mmetsp:Transcript_3800/g.6586  ORF Transcript_3800/g.6586 Transcript_3800/m.6586 type:complete len:264 (-) Transcript_3800:83-874(-)